MAQVRDTTPVPGAGVGRRGHRHLADLGRKYTLLGRERLIDGLAVPRGGSALELGCGVGRNLVLAARRYPQAQFHGLEICPSKLETARANLHASGLAGRAQLAQGDATRFDPQFLFGRSTFDCVYFSFALSMIADWERALTLAASVLSPGGSLHVVDFGDQEQFPTPFRARLREWLAGCNVEPRPLLTASLAFEAERIGARITVAPLYRGYAVLGTLRRSSTARQNPMG